MPKRGDGNNAALCPHNVRPRPAGAPLTRAAQQVSAALEPLRRLLADLEAGALEGDWEGGRDACARAADALRTVWGVRLEGQRGGAWAVVQARVQHFMGLIGSSLARYCQVRRGSTCGTADSWFATVACPWQRR
jgi:hypothetical protein